ncbi:MAG TPA: HAD hydrolase-like protein, partial [Rhodocyclaceae bacterium]|nr:HAD hydrolase-like protein [Rhodocyclaceae bacterium]
EKCTCRKPQPGMLQDILNRFNTGPENISVVGDALRDLQAAVAVGARPILVLTGKGKKTQADPALPANTRVFADLAAVAESYTV